MAPRRPGEQELRELADSLGIPIRAEDLAFFHAVTGALLGAYDALDAAAPPPPAERRWWVPAPDENPLGAWYVRTALRERDDGPLAGRTVALKDNVMLAGVPMLNGSAIFEDYVAEVDATVARRLLDAGAEIRGKAHCEDLCLSAGSHTNVMGPVRNPHDPSRTTGGSSSGSAALVASGEVDMAIGGDQGGSIRIPAAFCGIVGMKPTWGLVPYTGIAPIEPTLDHVGPMTAGVRDNALMLQAIAGPDGIDPRQSGEPAPSYTKGIEDGIEGLRIAILSDGFGVPGSQREVEAKVRGAATLLSKLGAHVSEVSVPIHREAGRLTLPLLVEGMYRTVLRDDGQGVGRLDRFVPGFGARARRWRERAGELSPLVVLMALAGAFADREYGTRYYGLAVEQARRVRAAYDAALAEHAILLLPTTPMVAPPIPGPDAGLAERVMRASEPSFNTQPFDVSHHPAISVPCGLVGDLPVGMMLVGRHGDEATLYRAAFAFEQAEDWRAL
jgi:amidase